MIRDKFWNWAAAGVILVALVIGGLLLTAPGGQVRAQTAGPTPTPIPTLSPTPAPPVLTPTETPPPTQAPPLTSPTDTPTPGVAPPGATPTATPTSAPPAPPGLTVTPTPTPTPTGVPSGAPNLTLQKQSNVGQAQVGTLVVYTIIVTNRGTGDATNVVVTDELPPELTGESASTTKGTVEITDNTVIVHIGTIAPGEIVTITINARVRGGIPNRTLIANRARLQSDQGALVSDIAAVDSLAAPIDTTGAGPGLPWPALLAGALLALLAAGLTRRRATS